MCVTACVCLYSNPLSSHTLTTDNVNSKTLRLKVLYQRGNRPAFSIRRSSHLSERASETQKESYRRRDGGLNLVTDPNQITHWQTSSIFIYTFSPPKNRLRFRSHSTNQKVRPALAAHCRVDLNMPAILFSGSGCYMGERADVAKRRG